MIPLTSFDGMRTADSDLDMAAERRKKNAEALSLALTVLGCAGIVACPLAGGPRSALLATVGQTLLCLVAYLVIRRGYFVGGVVLMIAGPLVQHIAIVASMGALTVLPFISTLAVLLAAATLPLRRLYLGVVLAAFAISSEVCFVDLDTYERVKASGVLAGAVLFLGVATVISVLHVHGTERAAALAKEREAARVRAAGAARASEERYRLIAENTIDLIALLDAEGTTTYLSPSHERVLGYSLEAILGKAFVSLIVEKSREQVERCFAEVLDTGHSRSELLFVGRDGTELLFDATFNRVRTAEGALIVALSRDITEKRALEENLQKMRRMDALGRMARGIAHDFNNLLVTMLGNTELAESALPNLHPAREDLSGIREAAQSASRLTQQLLAFSKSQHNPKAESRPAVELAKLSPLLANVVGKGIDLVTDVDAACPAVYLQSGHFEQLLLNLATNAKHAMNGQGRLIIGLKGRKVDVGEIAELEAGTYVELTVADCGAGIAPDVVPHLFEPFYTSRAGSGGTGLGLATCYGIVTQHGGQILVESELAKGTTFRVLLPVAAPSSGVAPLAESRPIVQIDPLPATTKPRVLLADDEPAVRDVAGRMLTTDGFEVHAFGTYAAAQAAVNDLSQHFDVILTDVVLAPGLGTDLLVAAQAVRPGVRCCAMSGFVPSAEVEAALRRTRATFVAKPFERATLLNAVRGDCTSGEPPAADAAPGRGVT